MENLKDLIHEVIINAEDVDLVSKEEMLTFYKHSLVYPKKEPGMVGSKLSGSSMEPRFPLGHPILRDVVVRMAKRRVESYKMTQMAAPGMGGALCLASWAGTGAPLKMATIRVDKDASHKRLDTRFEGFLRKDEPVWLTDDVLTSGEGISRTINILTAAGFFIGGFCPVFAHAETAGIRACQGVHSSRMDFVFDPFFVLVRVSRSERKFTRYPKSNSILFPNG